MYMRARSIPVNPNTGPQLQVRSALTELVMRWIDTLTAAQRAAWNLWAVNTPFTNPLGDSFNISGQNAYIGANTARRQSDAKLGSTLGFVDDAPTVYDRGDFTTPTFAADVVTGLTITFTNTDTWATEDGASMLVFQGQPKNPTRNFFKGPYRLLANIDGDSGGAPASPLVIGPALITALAGFPVSEGNANWLRFVVVRADGRYSSGRVVGPVIVTP